MLFPLFFQTEMCPAHLCCCCVAASPLKSTSKIRPGPHQELKKQGYTVEDIPDSVEGNCDFGTWGTKPRSGIYYFIGNYNHL